MKKLATILLILTFSTIVYAQNITLTENDVTAFIKVLGKINSTDEVATAAAVNEFSKQTGGDQNRVFIIFTKIIAGYAYLYGNEEDKKGYNDAPPAFKLNDTELSYIKKYNKDLKTIFETVKH